MTRRLLNLLAGLSLALCVAAVVLWVRSFEARTGGVTLTAGRWHVANCRGRIWVLRHTPNDDPTFLRTTLHLSFTPARPSALIKALVFDPSSPWDARIGMPSVLLFRPYILADLSGDGVADRCGFGFASARLPPRVPGLQKVGPVLRCVSVPHWFCVAVTGMAPALTLTRWLRDRRRVTEGCCTTCGYDLTGNVSGVCPECGEGARADAQRGKSAAEHR